MSHDVCAFKTVIIKIMLPLLAEPYQLDFMFIGHLCRLGGVSENKTLSIIV